MEPITLASSSPRRQEILKKMNIPFIVHPANIAETIPGTVKLKNAPEFLACKKVEAVAQRISAQQEEIGWILGADTAILYGNKLYGKPQSKEEAVEMIRKLQGHTHEVVTGLAIYNDNIHDISMRTSCNKVTFAPMSETDIAWYISQGEWHGAAGGYRIQGTASCFIKKIEGTESSIMGLPIFELYDMLREQNYSFD